VIDADEKEPETLPDSDIDEDALDALPPEEFEKLKRGEREAPQKDAKPPEKEAAVKDEFDVDPKSETVPHATFHRTNERRKAAEAERAAAATRAEQAEARANTAMQRMAELLEASKPAPAKIEEPAVDLGPDPEIDPIGALKWQREQRAADFEARKTADAQAGQQRQEQGQQAELLRAAANDVQAFKQQTPDYDQARNFYWNQRGPELMALGYSQEQAIQLIEQDELNIAHTALTRQQSPAKTLYAIAKARGYTPTIEHDAAEKPNGAEQPRDADGKFKAAAAAMDKREATKAAAKSLGGSGGSDDVGTLTAQSIVDMSESEFRAFKKKWDKELGEGGAMRKIHELSSK